MDTKPNINALSRKSQTPEWLLAELQSRVGEIEAMSVTLRTKDGTVASLASFAEPEMYALLCICSSRYLGGLVNDPTAGQGPR